MILGDFQGREVAERSPREGHETYGLVAGAAEGRGQAVAGDGVG